MRTTTLPTPARALLALILSCAFISSGHAALFEDDEARRAILELRQRVDVLQQRSTEDIRKSGDDSAQLRRGLLDLQTQIEALRVEQAKLRGQNEQLLRDVAGSAAPPEGHCARCR
jgi:hypothetical protein